jgi:outer membrane protein OmpA-like peptidoglycan-associated protein
MRRVARSSRGGGKAALRARALLSVLLLGGLVATPSVARAGPPGWSGGSDADGDGVVDARDACPQLAGVAAATASRNGCPPPGYYGPMASADVDHDRIDDMVDACPGLAGETSADPERHGCPRLADQDGDGLTDEVDACLLVGGPPSDDPRRNGCPMARIQGDRVVLLEPVSFESGSDRLDAGSRAALKAAAGLILSRPDLATLRVEGHTDDQGPRELNRWLSRQRALSVVGLLEADGVVRALLDAEGYGPDRPIASNDSPEGRAANRRVELHIVAWRDVPPEATDIPPPEPTQATQAGVDRAPLDSPARPQLVPIQDPGFGLSEKEPSTPMLPRDEPDVAKKRRVPGSTGVDQAGGPK